MNIAFVLWTGNVGGAERATIALAGELHRMGVETSVLFVQGPDRLVAQLTAENVRHESLGYPRGVNVTLHPRALASAVRSLRADVVIPVTVGYLGASIRAGGFRGPIIGVEHGELLRIASRPGAGRLVGWVDRLSGVLTHDAEIAVSRYMAERVRHTPHARRVVMIPHGVSLTQEAPPMPPLDRGPLVLGYVGRLLPGKGVNVLLRAIALLGRRDPPLRVILRVAGDGECRQAWEELARRLGIADRVTFLGWTDDVVGHWAQCHVAVTPSDDFVESFCMSAAEAMLTGRPAIVTDRGALPELVVSGVTGQIAAAGDDRALAEAIAVYVHDQRRVGNEGDAARRYIDAHFSLRQSATRYLELTTELLATRVRSSGRSARPT